MESVALFVSIRFCNVSLIRPSLFLDKLMPMRGGEFDTTEIEDIGAMFRVPSFDIVDTRHRGRGATMAPSQADRSL